MEGPHSVALLMLQCATLWIGESLGPIERACLRSVVRQGHRLALYCYREPKGIPERTEVRDASTVLPEQSVFLHRTGSVGPFSDWFRYELLRLGIGTWVDTDVYLVAPLDEERAYLFGEQEPGVLNNAVLRLPENSPMLPELLNPFANKTPRWLPPLHYALSRSRKWLTGRTNLAAMPWGTTGPHALTAVASELGYAPQALPPPVFYPVPWTKADWIRNPLVALEDVIEESTVAVHLWNECIKGFKSERGAEGSFLARLQREGAD